MTIKELKKVMEYSDTIMAIIQAKEAMTTSDLQAAIEAVVHKIMNETKYQFGA
jgi:hypothetical protein